MAKSRDKQGETIPTETTSERRWPPAIDIVSIAESGSKSPVEDRPNAYASPSRDILDTIGAPRAIQRVYASIMPGGTAPPRAYGSPSDDRQIHSVEDIGRRIRKVRKAMGMTQQRFADLAGVGRRFLIELENGKQGLEIGLVIKVCNAAGVRLGFL